MQLEYFRMVDRVTALDVTAQTVSADCLVPEASPVFEGHFPRHPILPGVLMIEAIAQTGGWLVMAIRRFGRIPFLAQVKDAKMRAFIAPGDRLSTEVRLLHDGSGYAVASGRIVRENKTVAEAELTYRVAPFPNDELRRIMLETARRLAVPEQFLAAA
jgi:3-hydroxyacyl-[acyl-carrier-protein] dehydratase